MVFRVTAQFQVNDAELGRQTALIIARKAAGLSRRMVAQAKQNAPVDTGNLARSVEEVPLRFSSPYSADFGMIARAHYARFVEDGTRPHVIRPRTAKALRFTVGGQVVFARYVNHPGTRARPFMRNAAATVLANDPDIT